jgi:DNA-binding HxlR family transcriptional regulator
LEVSAVRKDMRSGCPVNLSLEIFGDRWTLLVLRDIIFTGARHFRELLAGPERISSNILADRLAVLVEHGLLTKAGDPSHKQKVTYSLTEQAIERLEDQMGRQLAVRANRRRLPQRVRRRCARLRRRAGEDPRLRPAAAARPGRKHHAAARCLHPHTPPAAGEMKGARPTGPGPLLVGHVAEPVHRADAPRMGVPYPGGVFSDDLSAAATNAAVRAVLAEQGR